MNAAEQFFFEHAGWSYRPDHESEFVGRVLGAVRLARAEAWAREAGAEYEWDIDELDSSEWSDERPPWGQYVCVMNLPCATCGTRTAHFVAALGGIDFGRGNGPGYDQPYTRVVEAELASEARQR